MQLVARLGLIGTLYLVLFGCGGEGPTAAPAARLTPDGGTGVQAGGIIGASSNDDDDEPSASDDDEDVDEDFLVGRWRHEVGSCTYTYRFLNSGGFELTASAGEQIDGRYMLEQVELRPQRWQLTLEIDGDNGGEDCEGHQINEIGAVYLIIVDPVGDDRIDVFRSESSSGAAFRWTRLN
jgi:hypothetical protein